MSEEMQIDGKSYISSKRASRESGYAQDYIGQLARKSLIDARRIGGLWYISMESLQGYQKKAEEFKPEPPTRAGMPQEPQTLVFFDGKEYVSAARAAEVTGYAQDYVGQLARSGTVLSQQVGNRWYVEKQSILRHKSEKDHLLAAVQSESVGLSKSKSASSNHPEYLSNNRYSGFGPLLNYFNEDDDLMPLSTIKPSDDKGEDPHPKVTASRSVLSSSDTTIAHANRLSIRKVREYKVQTPQTSSASRVRAVPVDFKPQRSTVPMLLGAAATIIIVLSVGYASVLKQNSAYAVNISQYSNMGSLSAAAASAFEKIGDVLEPYLVHELNYESPVKN